jgi:hypothetical protein
MAFLNEFEEDMETNATFSSCNVDSNGLFSNCIQNSTIWVDGVLHLLNGTKENLMMNMLQVVNAVFFKKYVYKVVIKSLASNSIFISILLIIHYSLFITHYSLFVILSCFIL